MSFPRQFRKALYPFLGVNDSVHLHFNIELADFDRAEKNYENFISPHSLSSPEEFHSTSSALGRCVKISQPVSVTRMSSSIRRPPQFSK